VEAVHSQSSSSELLRLFYKSKSNSEEETGERTMVEG
jgi:hypothetical protein